MIDVAVRDLGIDEIRFTGGEPLLRKGIVALIEPGRRRCRRGRRCR